MGPLVRGAVAALDGGLDPADTVLPVATLPGLPLPSPFPVPDLRQRLYFRHPAPAFLPARRPFALENRRLSIYRLLCLWENCAPPSCRSVLFCRQKVHCLCCFLVIHLEAVSSSASSCW